MELGIVVNAREKPIEEQLDKAGELGFDFVEIVAEGPRADVNFLRGHHQEIRKAADENSLELYLHLPWTLDIGSPYEEYRGAALDILKNLLETGRKMNVGKATVHPKSYQRYWDEEEVEENIIDSLKELDKFSERKDIKLVVENTEEFDLLWFDDILQRTDLSMCLDTGHAILNGYDEREITGFVEENMERISHSHLNDNRRGEEDEHLSLGYGFVDLEQIIDSLKEMGWKGSLAIELFTEDMDYWDLSKRKVDDWLEE
ncbi:MAG: sugar phosphate isomerase/epimerase family protein [Candidatus Aenigmatarchaeota archaeon]